MARIIKFYACISMAFCAIILKRSQYNSAFVYLWKKLFEFNLCIRNMHTELPGPLYKYIFTHNEFTVFI